MMWPREEERARARQRDGGRAGGRASGKLPEALKGETRERVATRLGIKPRSLVKAVAIVEAAETDQEKYSYLAQ